MPASSDCIEQFGSISIVVVGEETEVGAKVLKHVAANPDMFHPAIDVRQWIVASPACSSIWDFGDSHYDAHLTAVQRALVESTGFLQACVSIVERIERTFAKGGDTSKVWVLYDSRGRFRAHGVAHCIMSRVFNAEPFFGSRRYNCNVFPTSEATPSFVVGTVLADAVQWATDPWMVVPSTSWGYEVEGQSFKGFTLLSELDKLAPEVCSGDHIDEWNREASLQTSAVEEEEDPIRRDSILGDVSAAELLRQGVAFAAGEEDALGSGSTVPVPETARAVESAVATSQAATLTPPSSPPLVEEVVSPPRETDPVPGQSGPTTRLEPSMSWLSGTSVPLRDEASEVESVGAQAGKSNKIKTSSSGSAPPTVACLVCHYLFHQVSMCFISCCRSRVGRAMQSIRHDGMCMYVGRW